MRFTKDTLLKEVLGRAIMDRKDFLECVGEGDPEARTETLALLEAFRGLRGKTFSVLTEEEDEVARKAFLSAEFWYMGMADAYGRKGAEAREAISMFRKIYAFRMKRWGKTKLESDLETMVAVPVEDILKMSHKVME